jgi:hypothetical protein
MGGENSVNGLGDAIQALITMIIVLLAVAVPLALWKLIDIVIWLYNHIGVTWK